jgi:hypothetical protein
MQQQLQLPAQAGALPIVTTTTTTISSTNNNNNSSNSSEYETMLTSLPTTSKRLVRGNISVETRDHDDHTYSGIMFDIEGRRGVLPWVEFIEIQSVSVRGALGRISVYRTPKTFLGKNTNPAAWERVFGPQTLQYSMDDFVELEFPIPLRLAPGMKMGLYIHSELPGDMAIVYDNQTKPITFEDNSIRIYPGLSHVSNIPFNVNGTFGYGWRERRQFVGRIRYGVRRYLVWRPDDHHHFPPSFRISVLTLLLCHRQYTCVLSNLDKRVLFKILSYCSWDWFD